MAASINQICWVVADIPSVARRWTQNGVGPFLTFDIDLPDAIYRGRPEPLQMSVALAQAGPLQIELIDQRSKGPSAYRDVVPEGQDGIHHVLRLTDNYDQAADEFRSRGIVLATEAVYGAPFCYADTREEIGVMTELVGESPLFAQLNEAIAAAARDWDGREITRPLAL